LAAVDSETVSPPTPGQVLAVAAGNALEFYDFLAYAFFAAQIGRAFFPSHDPSISLLSSLATFGVGFLMRPVGALVIGRIGDRFGRKPAMLTTFGLMGAAMIGLACVPSYARIGVAAPILVIACRFVQGFAVGGEVGSSTAYLIEASPARRRGFYVSLQYAAQQAAVLTIGLVGYALAHTLSDAQLDAWGWRVAFLIGALILPAGLALRAGLSETLQPGPAAAWERTDPRPLAVIAVVGVMIIAGGTTATYVLGYLTTFATETLHMPKTLGFAATVTTGLAGVICAPLGGALSDRFGRKPVMMIGWALLLLATLPGFMWVARMRSATALLGMAAVLAILNYAATAAVLVSLTESLPRRIRAGGLGVIYALAVSVFGGSTQFIVAWLTRLLHTPLAPAWYMTGAVAVSLVAMAMQPETAGRLLPPSSFPGLSRASKVHPL
jgi:MFS family permease